MGFDAEIARPKSSTVLEVVIDESTNSVSPTANVVPKADEDAGELAMPKSRAAAADIRSCLARSPMAILAGCSIRTITATGCSVSATGLWWMTWSTKRRLQ